MSRTTLTRKRVMRLLPPRSEALRSLLSSASGAFATATAFVLRDLDHFVVLDELEAPSPGEKPRTGGLIAAFRVGHTEARMLGRRFWVGSRHHHSLVRGPCRMTWPSYTSSRPGHEQACPTWGRPPSTISLFTFAVFFEMTTPVARPADRTFQGRYSRNCGGHHRGPLRRGEPPRPHSL